MTLRIITDSVADLPEEITRELDITVIPLNVRFGTDVYRDGVDLTPDEFYERLIHSKTLPVTSVAAPGVFAGVYDEVAEAADEILVIALSSKFSATYDVAQQGIEMMKQKCRIEVLDSQWAVMCQGFMVIAAARAAKAGASLDEALYIARSYIPRVHLRAAFGTLEYLKRGGRIGMAQAFLGSILNINPIIGMKDGEVFPYDRERSRAKALNYLYNFVAGFSSIEELAVEYATASGDAETLIERLGAVFPKERIYRTRVSPAIGTHTGPNLIVVSVLGDK
ncbi:MAG: DegV family protein [Chloroflexota bacterium]